MIGSNEAARAEAKGNATDCAIAVRDIKKSFGRNTAVDGVSFDVSRGEVFGLLGPNGAGKSTIINIMVGALRPDSGSVSILESGDPFRPSARRALGIAPQALAIYEELTAEENVGFFARLYDLTGARQKERIDWALDLAGLNDRRRDPVRTFSGGMKRRLNIACALTHEPKIVFLDEPTVGVDPQSRNYIFDSVERLQREGLTVVYTTHYMEEAQRLCNRVGVIDRGRMLALDSVDGLIDRYGGKSSITAVFEQPPPESPLPDAELNGVNLRALSDSPMKDVARLAQSGLTLETLSVDRPDLESVFLHLTGRSLRD